MKTTFWTLTLRLNGEVRDHYEHCTRSHVDDLQTSIVGYWIRNRPPTPYTVEVEVCDCADICLKEQT